MLVKSDQPNIAMDTMVYNMQETLQKMLIVSPTFPIGAFPRYPPTLMLHELTRVRFIPPNSTHPLMSRAALSPLVLAELSLSFTACTPP